MIYDSLQDLTWLQDTMYARTTGVDADGLMEWYEAEAWANDLEFGGYTDWRLPLRLGSYQLGENSSELSRMLVGLGWVPEYSGVQPLYTVRGGTGPFVNFEAPMYWFGEGTQRYWHEFWVSDFGSDPAGAWAVRDGRATSVVSVLEPTTLALVAFGALIAGLRISKKRAATGPMA